MTATIPFWRVRFTCWAIAQRYPVAGRFEGRWQSPAMSG